MLIKTAFFALAGYLLLTLPRPGKIRVNNRQLEKAAAKLFGKTRAQSIREFFDSSIRASNIKRYIPILNVPLFILFSLAVGLAGAGFSYQLTHSLTPSLAVGGMAGYLPKAMLDFMAVLNGKKIRRQYLSFLNAYYGFYNLSGDVAGAFRQAAAYTGEPLRSFIRRMVYRYDRSSLEFTACLDELGKEARDREFLKFIKFTKLHLIYGGDYRKALEKLMEQERRMEGALAGLSSSAAVGVMAVLALAGLDLAGLLGAYLMNPDVAAYLRSSWTGQLLVLGNLAAVGFGFYVAANLYKGV
jgi:Flp pilus assembly protein TadB